MSSDTIKQRIKMIEDLEEENKKARELLKSALENDPEYEEVAREAKEVLSKRRRIKERVMEEAGNKRVTEDIKANKEEIDTLQEILSAELVDYYSKTKTDQIEDSSGIKRKFKITVKLFPSQSYEN